MNVPFNEYISEFLVPSLQQVSAVRIIRIILDEIDMRSIFENHSKIYDGYCLNEFHKIDEQSFYSVSNKVSELPLPKALKSILRKYIAPIIGNLYNWITYHDRRVFNLPNSVQSSAFDYIHNIVWSPRGIVDYAKTGKNLLKIENLDAYEKFRVSCYCCLKDEMTVMSSALNSEYINGLCLDNNAPEYYFLRFLNNNYEDLIKRREQFNRERNYSFTLHDFLFIHVWSEDYEFKKYFWERLSEEEKNRKMSHFMMHSYEPEFLFSILRQSSCGQLQTLMRSSFVTIFCRLIHNPLWLDLVLPFVFYVLNSVDEDHFSVVLSFIPLDGKFPENLALYDHYAYILEELWKAAPKNSKDLCFKGINVNNRALSILHRLSWERNIGLVERIFSDAGFMQKKEIMHSNSSLDLCARFIKEGNWHFLDLFVEQALPEVGDIKKFKLMFNEKRESQIAQYCQENKLGSCFERYRQWILSV